MYKTRVFCWTGHPKKFKEMGIGGVVNLCSEYEGPVSAYKREGIEQLWIPSVDHFEPEIE